jgi:hypothetical protein
MLFFQMTLIEINNGIVCGLCILCNLVVVGKKNDKSQLKKLMH